MSVEEIAKDIYMHHFDDDFDYPEVLKAITVGFQKGAKSREKRIAELEKENAGLKESVNNWLKYEKETQYHKSIIKDLKKENAELKEKLDKINDYLANEIPHKLINEATNKIWRLL